MATQPLIQDYPANMSANHRWLVVGLSGVTGGGKTTLATKLLASLPTTTIYLNQDQYFLPNHHHSHLKAPEPLAGFNKDSLCSTDMRKMVDNIRHILATDGASLTLTDCTGMLDTSRVIGSALRDPRPPFKGHRKESHLPAVLLLDGFLLFNQPEVAAACDLLYFITLTRDQCWERREKRAFTSSTINTKLYFDACAWPKYEEHFQQMCNSVKGIHFIDGASAPDITYERVFKDIMNKLEMTAIHE